MDFLEGIPSQSSERPKVVILFTDEPRACLPLAAKLRSTGDRVQIVDSHWFDEMSIEFADRIIFVGASKREFIVRCFRSDYYRQNVSSGEVEFVDMDFEGSVLGKSAPEAKLNPAETLSATEFALPGEAPPAAPEDPPKAKKQAA